MTVYRLSGSLQHYRWGSTTVIPDLLGLSATDEPVAELWLGAHSSAPARVAPDGPDVSGVSAGADDPHFGRSLADLISENPRRELGRQVAARYGATLPFLLKVLAVEHPLSLQAHPTVRQAKAGFAAENAAGIPLDSPQRNYKDLNHKPEMICALTPFEALCGFRPVADTVEFWHALGAPSLLALQDRLLAGGGLRDVVTHLLTISATSTEALVLEVSEAAAGLTGTADRWAACAQWLVRLAQEYPGDRGVVLASLLNLVSLAPGDSMFLAAGQLHAYLHGTGVELMASSDNVLRGGLTSKHIDVGELVHILDFSETAADVYHPDVDAGRIDSAQVGPAEVDPAGVDPAEVDPAEVGPAEVDYPEHCPDFSLARLDLTPQRHVDRPAGRPQIMVCISGAAALSIVTSSAIPETQSEPNPREALAEDAAETALRRGAAVFVPASDAVTVRGCAPGTTVFVATTAVGG